MTEPIPIEVLQAQARLIQRRKVTKITIGNVTVEQAQPVAKEIEAPLLRLLETLKPEDAEQLKREQSAAVAQRRARRERELFALANCPARHARKKILPRGGPWDERMESLSARLGQGFLIALCGNRGNGKTQIAVELIRKNSARGRSSLFCTAVQFFMAIKAGYCNQVSEESTIEQYARPMLLVIDELGKRGQTDWEDGLLNELINRRYNSIADTLLISNLDPSAAEQDLGASIVSRARETGGLVECDWASFRK